MSGNVTTGQVKTGTDRSALARMFIVSWIFCVAFYFLQYAVRSAPSVMMDELSSTFGLTTASLGSLLGLYYYTYSCGALVSGACLDRWGAKYPIPIGTAILAVGIAMFGLGAQWMASVGRLLQGLGAAFAFVGAIYVATRGIPKKWLATAVGFTQCVGMLGGAMGQPMVNWLIHHVVGWRAFWIDTGIVTAVVAVAIWVVTPAGHDVPAGGASQKSMFAPYSIVLTNPQSWLCGLSAGLLFLPTTVGSMTWGVSFLTNGWHLSHDDAVWRAASVAMGWVFGCPVLGYLSDHFGRRKPVIFGGIIVMALAAAAIVWLPSDTFPPYTLGFILGFASGAAMIPYTIIKEVNPDEVKGSATGAANFIVFVLSAIASPLFSHYIQHLAGGKPLDETVFSRAFSLGLVCIIGAGLLAIPLRETGWAARKA